MSQQHHHHNHHHHGNENGLSVAFFLNLGFSIVEFIGGILTNSTAIITDSFHDFLDAFAIGASLYFEKLSKKKRTETFSYGYRRFNLVSALGLSIILLVGASIMIYTAGITIRDPKPVHSVGMLILAIFGIGINGLAYFRLRKEITNNNKKAVMLHLLEDVLGWVAVLAGAILIYFTHWYWIDGVLAIGIASFIFYNASKNIIQTMKIMLQSVPDNIDIQQLSKDLNQLDEISGFHDLHIWTLDGNYHVGSIHILVPGGKDIQYPILYKKVQDVFANYQIEHATIQIENQEDNCPFENC